MTLTVAAALVVTAGAFAGGFVSGLAGFGTGLVAVGFWLYVIPPGTAATLVAICSVVAQVQTIPAIWHAIDRRRILPMVLAGLLGVPVGTMLLSQVDMGMFRLSVGILLVGFSAFMLVGRIRTRLVWGGRVADSAVGFAGGILGGLAGLSGPLPIMWAALRGWTKDERRGVFQAFNLVILGAVVIWHAILGLFTVELGLLVLVAMPGTFAGVWLGTHAYRRLSDRRFHEIVLGMLAMSGLTLIWASR